MQEPTDQLNGTSLEVELDAFSGRPNPRWTLTGAESEELRGALRALRPGAENARVSDGLGYRGFVVRGARDELRVYRGTVVAHRVAEREDVLADPERSLERLLLQSARSHVPEAVLRYVESEIEA